MSDHDSSVESKDAEEPGSIEEASLSGMVESKHAEKEQPEVDLAKCICTDSEDEARPSAMDPTQLEEILKEKERELREDYQKILEREKQFMKERFEFILLNEQTRTSYMLREAHRERQEKIHALQTQLQCKNLAALMYVMCTERRRSRIEKLRIIQDYTNYINVLQDILTQGQELILHLSRGYKTAARVDHEWREKMKKVVSEFMSFIYNFAGGDPETNQYLIDLPKLLTTKAPIVDNPEEDPCCDDEDEDYLSEIAQQKKKFWWDELDAENRPFVLYGDMADFEPAQRREVTKHIRAKKTAPPIWKKYAFKDMFLMSKCLHLDGIKDRYQLPVPIKWDCAHAHAAHPENGSIEVDILKRASKASIAILAKPRSPSIDVRGMGSILKIITSSPPARLPPPKTALLGARDSMEIASTTKLREKQFQKQASHLSHKEQSVSVVLDIGKKRASVFEEVEEEEHATEQPVTRRSLTERLSAAYEDEREDPSVLGSIHNDSLHIRQSHEPEQDRVNYEKVCPMEQCQRLQVDSFMRSLPPYMRANPFTHISQTFEEYETCTPEQLEILKQRIEQKLEVEAEVDKEEVECPVEEWTSTGVGVQTSDLELLEPCTCDLKRVLPEKASSFMFDLADLMPVKVAMDAVHRECFYDKTVDFNRFKLIGKDKDESETEVHKPLDMEFQNKRYEEIKKILKKHPSLLDIFQANVK